MGRFGVGLRALTRRLLGVDGTGVHGAPFAALADLHANGRVTVSERVGKLADSCAGWRVSCPRSDPGQPRAMRAVKPGAFEV